TFSPYFFSCNLFIFNDTSTSEIYTLSLHDALPICRLSTESLYLEIAALRAFYRFAENEKLLPQNIAENLSLPRYFVAGAFHFRRSEEHTSELQSLAYLVCRLLLEKKKQK